jgi:hypothetical protein
MATTHKLISNGQLLASGDAGYASGGFMVSSSSVETMVKTILFYNTNTTTETVTILQDHSSDADKIMLKFDLLAGETFEWTVGHMIVVADGEKLWGNATTSGKVNFFIYGAEES